MKPRNELQRRVLKYSHKLPPLTDFQRREAIRKVAPHIAKLNAKKEYVCLDCGHSWKGEYAETIKCPHCGTTLSVEKDRKSVLKDAYYIATVTKSHGFQVIRMFWMHVSLRKGEKAEYEFREVFQRWLTPVAGSVIVGRRRHYLHYYCDTWDWGSDMEIRQENVAHTIGPYDVIGKSSVIPEIIRNGFDGDFHHCSPYALFFALLTDNKVETAWKTGQYELVKHSIREHSYQFNKYWNSIKVAIRHHYKIKDASLWYDMLDALKYCGKDLKNPKFICPTNFKEAHDYWINQKRIKENKEERRRQAERQIEEEQRYLNNLKRVAEREERYRQAKSRFFDLEFKDGAITIRPLTSVQEFVEEGHNMRHCVFTNGYYEKDNVLILHASYNGENIATIELSLESLQVVQCRGVHNMIPPHKEKIEEIIQNNIGRIEKKLTA